MKNIRFNSSLFLFRNLSCRLRLNRKRKPIAINCRWRYKECLRKIRHFEFEAMKKQDKRLFPGWESFTWKWLLIECFASMVFQRIPGNPKWPIRKRLTAKRKQKGNISVKPAVAVNMGIACLKLSRLSAVKGLNL